MSGFWNWAKETGQLKGENIWTDVEKGLKRDTEKKPLDKAKLLEAEAKQESLGRIFSRKAGAWKHVDCSKRKIV